MKDKVEISSKKIILLSVLLVTLTAALVGVGTFAYFSATQSTGPHDFSTGSIIFTINDANPWTGNFNTSLSDLKPAMTRWGNVTLANTGTNPADIWMRVTNVSTFSSGTNSAKEADPGYPAIDIDQVINYGVYNWSTTGSFPPAYVAPAAYVINRNASSVPVDHLLAGATNVSYSWIYLGNLQSGAAININESFRMNESVGNWAQLTNMTFTVDFYAQQSEGDTAPAAPGPELAGHTR